MVFTPAPATTVAAPDLPSATLWEECRSPPARCGLSPISHRLHYWYDLWAIPELRPLPDLPSATLPGRWMKCGRHVAASPRSPIGYTAEAIRQTVPAVAASPRSPIGYTLTTPTPRPRSSCGLSPISHRLH